VKELEKVQGRFGVIRVFERIADGARLYCIDASVQTMTRADGVSLFGYVHAINKLVDDAREILVLGGAGGSLATMLAARGAVVTVVDIDPAALPLARRHFGLDTSVEWVTSDAIAYLNSCQRQFDAIIMDACDATGTIASLMSEQTLARMTDNLRAGGVLIVNFAGIDGPPAESWDVACALADAGLNVSLFRPEDGWEGNEILYASMRPAARDLDIEDLHEQPAEARTYLMSLRAYTPTTEAKRERRR
jgi:predicted membrane-bound spermidine synthase